MTPNERVSCLRAKIRLGPLHGKSGKQTKNYSPVPRLWGVMGRAKTNMPRKDSRPHFLPYGVGDLQFL
jgi:hypothetical protein